MLSHLLYKIYSIESNIVKRAIRSLLTRMEGGQLYSRTLREIYYDYHEIEIGMYSYGGCFDLRKIPAGTRIGRFGSFSSFRVFPRNHPLDYLSMHPFFYNTSLGYVDEDVIPSTKLTIGHGVWIGYNSIILPKVTEIGNGAVIGAGAVVSKNVPPYAVVIGNPSRIVKYRFSADIVREIEQTRWWEKDISVLAKSLSAFVRPFQGTSINLNSDI